MHVTWNKKYNTWECHDGNGISQLIPNWQPNNVKFNQKNEEKTMNESQEKIIKAQFEKRKNEIEEDMEYHVRSMATHGKIVNDYFKELDEISIVLSKFDDEDCENCSEK